MTNLAALPPLTERAMTRRDLDRIASLLFASALATRQYANSLGEDDDERDAIADVAGFSRRIGGVLEFSQMTAFDKFKISRFLRNTGASKRYQKNKTNYTFIHVLK